MRAGSLALRREAAVPARAVAASASAAVLGPASLARPLAAALALRLAAESGAGHALLAGAAALAAPPVPPCPAAARCARVLAGAGVDARASGRLVHVLLDAEAPEAEFVRVAATAPGPVVLIQAESRTPRGDALLSRLDAVLLAAAPGADERLTGLAVDGLGALGVRAHLALAGPGPVARALALAGVMAAEPLRSAVQPAIEALR
jgi:hypothetical protein